MNRSKFALLAVLALCAVTVADLASARGYYRGHYRHRPSVGLFVGAPLLFAAPFYAYPRYYYPPAYYPGYYPPVVSTYPASPPVYIEQSQGAAPQAPTQGSGASWYYCADSQTYYPYVQQCASPWQQVAPQSVPPS
jgi:hypothetical protein